MLKEYTLRLFAKELADCTDKELYFAALSLCNDKTNKMEVNSSNKKLYYISAEFLIGKLLSNNLLNLGLWEKIESELAPLGKNIANLENAEPEPSLGNGGLGRLAACFIDSISTLGLTGDGVGLLYHFGLFRQKFTNYKQTEHPDSWLEKQNWLNDSGKSFDIKFPQCTLKSRLYEIAVPGYNQEKINKLRLFDLESVDTSLISDGINFDKEDIFKNLTLFLYPDDSDKKGQMLRIYQQYFLVSSAAQLILHELKERGKSINELADAVVIQINDTHPSMIIPELIRLMMLEGISFDRATDLVKRTCAYTNHTILAEALEKWPIDDLQLAVPELVPIIKQLDEKVKAQFPAESLAIIDENNLVHMARLDMHYGFSINGVAALHTEILKNSELKPFYDIYPENFNNKTNGITFRRWLMVCNPNLSKFITQNIGELWKTDSLELEKLLSISANTEKLNKLYDIKQNNKLSLANFLFKEQNVKINTESIFDIQIKRLHEYKRQQMNLLYIIWKYLKIKQGILPKRPITFFFAAKAAPAYILAKDIIHAILCLSKLINDDDEASKWLQIVFVENYNVKKAEMLIPAADISEQISTASKEASGTGNMKLMLNGAVTLGTMDGANTEIAELVGNDNIYIFGKRADEIIKLYESGKYNAKDFAEDKFISPLLDFILSKPMLKIGDAESLGRLYQDLTHKDWFMALLDLKEYITVKETLFNHFENREEWLKKSLTNIAKAGFFSSDRTILDYNRDIWKLN